MSEVERIRPIAPAYGAVQRVEPQREQERDRQRRPHQEDVLELHETEEETPTEEAEIVVLEFKPPVENTVHIDIEA